MTANRSANSLITEQMRAYWVKWFTSRACARSAASGARCSTGYPQVRAPMLDLLEHLPAGRAVARRRWLVLRGSAFPAEITNAAATYSPNRSLRYSGQAVEAGRAVIEDMSR